MSSENKTIGPLFKTTLVIWSDFSPSAEEDNKGNVTYGMNIDDLAREAVSGDAYCSVHITERIDIPETDPDWDGTEFFGILEDEDEDESEDEDE